MGALMGIGLLGVVAFIFMDAAKTQLDLRKQAKSASASEGFASAFVAAMRQELLYFAQTSLDCKKLGAATTTFVNVDDNGNTSDERVIFNVYGRPLFMKAGETDHGVTYEALSYPSDFAHVGDSELKGSGLAKHAAFKNWCSDSTMTGDDGNPDHITNGFSVCAKITDLSAELAESVNMDYPIIGAFELQYRNLLSHEAISCETFSKSYRSKMWTENGLIMRYTLLWIGKDNEYDSLAGASYLYPDEVATSEDESIYQNQKNPVDVNGDGSCSPLDVLQIINRLNRVATKPEFASVYPTKLPYLKTNRERFWDINGDGYVNKKDAEAGINSLNRGGGCD